MRVTITPRALQELRERMARFNDSEIWITGPFEVDSFQFFDAKSLEEAWHLEKLYGKAPRWQFFLWPPGTLQEYSARGAENFHVENVDGIPVGVSTFKTVDRLTVELVGDAIRVYENDA